MIVSKVTLMCLIRSHVCGAVCTAKKNLAIRESVYRKLAEEKRQDESFSDVIERILEKRGSLLPLWGSLADSESIVKIQEDTVKLRRSAKIRA